MSLLVMDMNIEWQRIAINYEWTYFLYISITFIILLSFIAFIKTFGMLFGQDPLRKP